MSLTFPRTISIHALREEGDARSRAQGGRLEISIHALREEGDSLKLRPVMLPQ